MRSDTILIIEDDETLREGLCLALKETNRTVCGVYGPCRSV